MPFDDEYMKKALELAEKALISGEAPVGAVVVDLESNEIIGSAYNRVEYDNDPLAHAEVIALRRASAYKKSRRLDGCALYVTLEPCLMCAGAVMLARIRRLVYGAYAPKTGAVSSVTDIFDLPLGYKPMTRGGVLSDECAALMNRFGRDLREHG